MRIIRARLKPYGGSAEFISIEGKIRGLIDKNRGDMFHFVIDDGAGVKTVKEFGSDNINPELVGKTLPIVNDLYFAQFNDDGTIDVVTNFSESLPKQSTVDQLKRVMKISAKTDIGNRISDMDRQGANIQYIRNPIYTGIESYEDFEKKNKKFIPSWNLKYLLSPFSNSKKKKK